MPLYIKDDATAELVSELARRQGVSKREAVQAAVQAALDRLPETPSFHDKLAALYEKYPLPEPTGEKADKAFFDELSGEFD